MKKMMRHTPSASAYMNDKFILIITRYGCPGGGYDYLSFIYFFPFDSEEIESLGRAVLSALESSTPVAKEEFHKVSAVKNQDKYNDFFYEVMKRFSYKNKYALFKKMKFVSIEKYDNDIEFSPYRRVRFQAWDGLPDDKKIIIPCSASPAEAGAALRLAFERCR